MLHSCARIVPSAASPFRHGLRAFPTRHYSNPARLSSSALFRPVLGKNLAGQCVLKTIANTSVAMTMAVGGPLLLKRPVVVCEARQDPPAAMPIHSGAGGEKNKVIQKREIAFGTVLGVCAGYFIKKIGKFFIFMVGLGFVCLQYMSAKGYVTVHWDRMAQGYNREFDMDKDGRVTTRDINAKWQTFVRLLTHHLQFKSTFLVGLYAGIRYG